MGLYAAINILTFIIYGVDKYRAKTGKWRIPERWLIALAFLGGFLGAFLGMVIFRHKIKKTYFWVWVGIASLIHLAIIGYVLITGY